MIRKNSMNRAKESVVFAQLFPSHGILNHRGLARTMKYMVAHFHSPIQLRELVAESGMSRRGFMKAFNKHLGKTPAAMLRQMRIAYAKHLLVTEDLPLNALVRRVGFRSANTFCVAFQRAEGIAPKKFQRSAWLAFCKNNRQPEFNARNKPSQFLRTVSRSTNVSQTWV